MHNLCSRRALLPLPTLTLSCREQDDTTLRPNGRRAGIWASLGQTAQQFPNQVAACGLTLFSIAVYAVIRRRRSSPSSTETQDTEHSPLATLDESEGIATAEQDEGDDDGSTSEADERESVSERKALTGLV